MPTTNYYLSNELYNELVEDAKEHKAKSVPVRARQIIEAYLENKRLANYADSAKKEAGSQ